MTKCADPVQILPEIDLAPFMHVNASANGCGEAASTEGVAEDGPVIGSVTEDGGRKLLYRLQGKSRREGWDVARGRKGEGGGQRGRVMCLCCGVCVCVCVCACVCVCVCARARAAISRPRTGTNVVYVNTCVESKVHSCARAYAGVTNHQGGHLYP